MSEGRAPASRARRHRGFRWRKHAPVVLFVAALACAAVSVAQFRLGREATEGTVVLVIDDSRSMRQTDVEPDRLTAAVDAAQTFLQRLPKGFRVGLVTFAGQAAEVVTPTTDRAEVAAALDALEAGSGAGTVIGDGLSAALDGLEADWQRNGSGPAAVVLLSDGRDTGSEVPPEGAAGRARGLDALVFTVVIGEPGASTGQGGANFGLLQEVAQTTGGRSFTAGTAGELKGVYDTLGSELSLELAISNFGAVFLVAATVLALAAGVAAMLAARRTY